MTDSIIMERVADAAADCLYGELIKTEDFEAFERIVAADMRSVAAMALRRCIERFDSELRGNAPRAGRGPASSTRTRACAPTSSTALCYAGVADFELATPFKVYFCDPHSPWERPSNENMNGLVREFFPKGTRFSEVTDEEVARAQWLLNNRPRKVLGWKIPSEAMQEVLAEGAMTA